MDKGTMLQKIADSEEDRLLLARVYDKIDAGVRRQIPTNSAFLSPREQILVHRLFPGDTVRFFSGTENGERAVCCFLPDYLEPEHLQSEQGPLAAVRAVFFKEDKLTHRDFLGSLMGCGIKRETVGDIFVSEGQCDFLITREILPYILQNLTSAGRTKLHCTQIPLYEVSVPREDYREIRSTVSSLRLDSLLSAGFGIARGKASAVIESGRVMVNDLPTEKPDKLLAEGDKISARGMGKLRLAEVGGRTKKDRIGVTIHRFG